jgi:hypothetical protein
MTSSNSPPHTWESSIGVTGSSNVGSSTSTSAAKQFILSVHDEKFSAAEVVLHPDFFPKARAGDLFEIYHPDKRHRKVLLQVPPATNAPIKGSFQISLSKFIASLFDLSARKTVIVEPVELESVKLTTAEIILREINVDRNEMWKLVTALRNTVVFVGKKLSFSWVRKKERKTEREEDDVHTFRSVRCTHVFETFFNTKSSLKFALQCVYFVANDEFLYYHHLLLQIAGYLH